MDAEEAAVVVTLGAERRRARDLRWPEWALLCVGLVSVVATLGLTIERLVQFAPTARHHAVTSDFAFALLMTINSVFCIYYIISGVWRERKFEILAFVLSVVVAVFYATLDYALRPDHRSTLKLIRLSASWVAGPVDIGLSFLVVRSFGWLEFRSVGPSHTMQKMFNQRSIFYSLISLDLQMMVSFICLGLTSGTEDVLLEEILIPSIGIPASIAWSILAFVAGEMEWVGLSFAVGLTGVVAPTYAFAQSIRLFFYVDVANASLLVISTAFAAALAVGIRVALYFEFAIVARNYGRGLRRPTTASE